MPRKGYQQSKIHRSKIGFSNTKINVKKSCLTCNKIFEVSPSCFYRKFCSVPCRKGHVAWNKGIKIDRKKYPVMGHQKKHSLEVKEKISIAKKNSHGFLGKHHSEETKEKLRQLRLLQIFPRKSSKIELVIQNFLKQQGIVFETHYPILGQPDIFIKPNICIFADGCYWHKCSACGFGEGRERDKYVTQTLQSQGYTVIRLWEHDINKMKLNNLNY